MDIIENNSVEDELRRSEENLTKLSKRSRAKMGRAMKRQSKSKGSLQQIQK